MRHRVDQEMANSQRGTDLETEAARQSHYIEWTRIIGIPDPCGLHEGYKRIVALYTKYLQSGINYYNKNNLQSATLCGYVGYHTCKITLPVMPLMVPVTLPILVMSAARTSTVRPLILRFFC
jgi:hypothetical protein